MKGLLFIMMGLFFISTSASGKETNMAGKSKNDQKYIWNLQDLYKSEAAWEQDLQMLKAELKQMKSYHGQVTKSAKSLVASLELQFSLTKRFYRLHNYATRLHDQNGKDISGQELFDRIGKIGTELEAKLAFIEPEILATPKKDMNKLLQKKRLKPYKHYIDNIIRRSQHVLSPKEEELIAQAGNMANLPESTYEVFSTLNLPFPTVTLKDGTEVTLTQANYGKYRGTSNRQDRIKIFKAFWQTYTDYKETYASLLSGAINRDHYYATVRKYPSDLEASLDATNVPVVIYKNMIAQIKKALPLLWDYLKIKKQLLRVKELHYHDLYASMIPSIKLEYPYDHAQDILLKALAPLGKDYITIMQQAFDNRWTHVFPQAGKRSGAYMSGSAYDVHPYVLLNYNNDYDSLSTLAHEFGHAAHSYLSNKYQPFHDAHYPIFTAEVASITNEHLLRLAVVNEIKDRKKQLYFLGEYLENWRTTVFRQAMFAEFELKIHEMSAQGKPLTAQVLSETYLTLLQEYYGEKQGITKIDPLYAIEWAFIPHFYYNFYMFQYTTSFIASTAIAEQVFKNDTNTRDHYLAMLKAGGSKYPVALLKLAGVDMTQAKPYDIALNSLKQALKQTKQLLP